MTDQENQLAEQISMLLKIIAMMPGNVYWVNQDNIYQGCNDNMARISGLSATKEIVGKRNCDLPWNVNAGFLPQTLDLINDEIMKTGQARILEEIGVLLDGQKVVYLSNKVPLRDEKGTVVGLIGISVDITQLKNTEQALVIAKNAAESADKAKTEFLENMRHDIRTPLTGIVGCAETLKMACREPEIQGYTDTLIQSSYALLHLMDNVLEAIRVGSGEIPKLKKKFNVFTLLQEIVALNAAKATQKKLVLSLEADASMPRYVVGDNIRMHRITLELVANALNFTEKGFVKLSMALAKRNQRELILKLMVTDSGMGISKNKQQALFVQFKRLTPSYQGIYQGTGLGLSVVRQFIDELGGEIHVKSKPGQGSTFTCLIPMQEALLDDDSGIEVDAHAAYQKMWKALSLDSQEAGIHLTSLQTKHRILLVEDSVIAQKSIQSLLTKMGLTIDLAENGQRAMTQVKAKHYDLILMDIGLPDLDGYTVTRQIRLHELNTKTPHNPTSVIIALTAHSSEENKLACINAGMNAMLTKPLTTKQFIELINHFLPERKYCLSPT